jgi:hypothetical protein
VTLTGKLLLVIGAFVCFGPALFVLLFGVFVGGPQILFWARSTGPSALLSFAPMVGGVLGVIGIANLVLWICIGRRFAGPRASLTLLASGVASISAFLLEYSIGDWGDLLTLLVLPIVGTACLGYVARDFLFRSLSGHKRDVVPSA